MQNFCDIEDYMCGRIAARTGIMVMHVIGSIPCYVCLKSSTLAAGLSGAIYDI